MHEVKSILHPGPAVDLQDRGVSSLFIESGRFEDPSLDGVPVRGEPELFRFGERPVGQKSIEACEDSRLSCFQVCEGRLVGVRGRTKEIGCMLLGFIESDPSHHTGRSKEVFDLSCRDTDLLDQVFSLFRDGEIDRRGVPLPDRTEEGGSSCIIKGQRGDGQVMFTGDVHRLAPLRGHDPEPLVFPPRLFTEKSRKSDMLPVWRRRSPGFLSFEIG